MKVHYHLRTLWVLCFVGAFVPAPRPATRHRGHEDSGRRRRTFSRSYPGYPPKEELWSPAVVASGYILHFTTILCWLQCYVHIYIYPYLLDLLLAWPFWKVEVPRKGSKNFASHGKCQGLIFFEQNLIQQCSALLQIAGFSAIESSGMNPKVDNCW